MLPAVISWRFIFSVLTDRDSYITQAGYLTDDYDEKRQRELYLQAYLKASETKLELCANVVSSQYHVTLQANRPKHGVILKNYI